MTFRVGWAQTDANAHMRNTAFLDYCVDVRFSFFEQLAAEVEDGLTEETGIHEGHEGHEG
jgi:acyl-CoA thioesterase FadM